MGQVFTLIKYIFHMDFSPIDDLTVVLYENEINNTSLNQFENL